MRRAITAGAIALLSVAMSDRALAQDVSPERNRYQLERALDAAQAQASFQIMVRDLALWREVGRRVPCFGVSPDQECWFVDYDRWLAAGRPGAGWGRAVGPPYVIYVPFSSPLNVELPEDRSEVYTVATAWAPADSVLGGRDSIVSWARQADATIVGPCRAGACRVVVEAFASVGTSRVIIDANVAGEEWVNPRRHFATCTVSDGPSTDHVPRECVQLAFEQRGTWWFLVERGHFGREMHILPAYSPRDLDLRVHFAPRRASSLADVLSASERVLRGAPLEYATDLASPRVRALGSGRISPVLGQPWREQADITIIGHGNTDAVGLELILALYVNRYATDRPRDWHLPSETQRADYQKRILEAIGESLAGLCRRPVWSDSRTLRCSR